MRVEGRKRRKREKGKGRKRVSERMGSKEKGEEQGRRGRRGEKNADDDLTQSLLHLSTVSEAASGRTKKNNV